MADLGDILVAYGFSPEEMTLEESGILHKQLAKTKRTYNYIQKAVDSDRSPEQILKHANDLGMFIPAEHRYGLNAYNYYINNAKQYETVLDADPTSKFPSLQELFVADRPLEMIAKFKDHQIINSVHPLIKSFDSRLDLLERYIEDNIKCYGRFNVPIHSIVAYEDEDANTIFYTHNDEIQVYSIAEIDALLSSSHEFDNLSLLQLRLALLKKVYLWREMNPRYETPDCVIELIRLLDEKLEAIPYKELARNYMFTENMESLENVVVEN